MRLVFGVLAALLFVIGAALFIGAVNLIPTDLGLVYLQGGITMITGGAIILAIGFSAPKPRTSLTRKAAAQKRARDVSEGSNPMSMQESIHEAGSPLNKQIFAPIQAIEPALETQRDSLMAAFERDLGNDITTELENPQSAQEQSAEEKNISTPFKDGMTDAAFDHPAPHTERTASSGLGLEMMDFQDAEPMQVKQEAVNRFELPALDMTIRPTEKEALGDISHPARPFEPERDHQEHLSDFPMNVDENPAQARPENTWNEEFVSHENAPFSEGARSQLAPLSELDVVGSYESAGTRFTMYSDGSVVTSGAEGEQRFLSLDALRAFLATKA